ncbi:hypothetical protein BaRGS_00004398 [Batillaria attramentaria]|uniref:Uncharacterized protein n=1 Tax=Batillaria attramentaria TaxID=370345 RepID=A0ABD0LYM3_9CAEN
MMNQMSFCDNRNPTDSSQSGKCPSPAPLPSSLPLPCCVRCIGFQVTAARPVLNVTFQVSRSDVVTLPPCCFGPRWDVKQENEPPRTTRLDL